MIELMRLQTFGLARNISPVCAEIPKVYADSFDSFAVQNMDPLDSGADINSDPIIMDWRPLICNDFFHLVTNSGLWVTFVFVRKFALDKVI